MRRNGAGEKDKGKKILKNGKRAGNVSKKRLRREGKSKCRKKHKKKKASEPTRKFHRSARGPRGHSKRPKRLAGVGLASGVKRKRKGKKVNGKKGDKRVRHLHLKAGAEKVKP